MPEEEIYLALSFDNPEDESLADAKVYLRMTALERTEGDAIGYPRELEYEVGSFNEFLDFIEV